MIEAASVLALVAGAAFILAGTIGLLRFPDVYTRLHALAKADNVGLGLIVAGLVLRTGDVATALKLVATWLLVLVANASAATAIAARAQREAQR